MSAGLRDTNAEQIDKSEERGRATWPRSDRRLVLPGLLVPYPADEIRREEAVCRRLSARDVTRPKGGECARTRAEFCHWL